MPKTTKDFPCRIEFVCSCELRVKLIALAFLAGHGKQSSALARNLLNQAIETAVARLSPDRRAAYEDILKNVKVMEEGKQI